MLTARLAGATREILRNANARRIPAAPVSATDARSLVERGSEISTLEDLASIRAARKLFREAIDKDPNMVAAWVGHGYMLYAEHWLDFAGGRNEELLSELDDDSRRALALDDRDGLSLRFYLLAQRAFGAARTGSVLAFAPFIGAALDAAMAFQSMTWLMALGGALMLAGVVLHLTETHRHEHLHEAMEHEHAHAHDDGHHDHLHDPMPSGVHSHLHRHEPTRHERPHVSDAHHAHPH